MSALRRMIRPTPTYKEPVLLIETPALCYFTGGAEGNRTPDLFIANEALCQLSYSPVECVESLAVAVVNQKARIG